MHNFLYIIVMALLDMAAIYDPKRGSKKSFSVTGEYFKSLLSSFRFMSSKGLHVHGIVTHFTYFHLNLKGFKS